MSDDLIRQLVCDLRPVERLASPARSAVWFASSAVVATLASAWPAGIRGDLALKLHEPVYLAETATLLTVFGAATLAAFSSGVPGARLKGQVCLLTLAAGAWLMLIGTCLLGAPVAASLTSGLACLRRTLLLGIVPAWALFTLLRRSVPLARGASGSLVMTAAGALAVLGTRVLCGKDDNVHVLLWHALPLAALALVGLVVGRAWLGGGSARTPGAAPRT